MAITTFTLPVDIPWQRIAFSSDMMDPFACDRVLPPRWKSSVAVFSYEPPEDQQRTDDFRTSYLKVSCTITGYQADGKEIRMRERIGRSGWSNADLTDRLGEQAAAYYPCNGAILEVVVAPHDDDKRTFDQYPYFADFDPKTRELYEVVTETGEVMSRSLEDVNVRLGQTTLQSHTVLDKTNLAGTLAGTGGGASATGSIANESGTTDLSQQGAENVRTSDASREARETFSHTTQLSQMYHQLDSYHLGSNRASFFILPRPHTVQSPSTFVNGPREIEGVQEFMLVVVRPKALESFCVEAYLETAHLTGKPDLDSRPTKIPFTATFKASDAFTTITDTKTSPAIAGYIVDTAKGPQGVSLGGTPHGDTGGFELTSVNENGSPRTEGSFLSNYSVLVAADSISITGTLSADGYGKGKNANVIPTTLDINAIVYLKKEVPTIVGYEPGLMITARAVCSCGALERTRTNAINPSIVFEKSLASSVAQPSQQLNSMPIRDANRLGAVIKTELLQSLSSADRYPRGTVDLLDTQLFAGLMSAHLKYAGRDVNTPLLEWPGIDKKLARRVTAYAPSINRSQMLAMPLAQQVESFGLSFPEAVELRRALADIAAPKGPPPIPARVEIEMPLLIGLRVDDAQGVLARAGLAESHTTVVDSPMPCHTVTAQEPAAGAMVEKTAAISVRLASGRTVRLPDIAGLHFSEAACLLREAGLRSEPVVEGRPGPEALVAEFEPKAGTLITPNTSVTIRLKQRPRVRR